MAIECNPAYLELGHIERLKAFGFNRVSMGVQDFNIKILDAINRKLKMQRPNWCELQEKNLQVPYRQRCTGNTAHQDHQQEPSDQQR